MAFSIVEGSIGFPICWFSMNPPTGFLDMSQLKAMITPWPSSPRPVVIEIGVCPSSSKSRIIVPIQFMTGNEHVWEMWIIGPAITTIIADGFQIGGRGII